jgi:hypothetical protein
MNRRLAQAAVVIVVAGALAVVGLIMSDHVLNTSAPPGWSPSTNTSVPLGPTQPRPHNPEPIKATDEGNPCQNGNWGIINNCGVLDVGFTASQVHTIMYDTLVYGLDTAAYYACIGDAYYSQIAFNDCYGILQLYPYSFPIMQYVASWGQDTIFVWTNDGYDYAGWTV